MLKCVICPICKREVTARQKIDYAFRNHLAKAHNITDQDKQIEIIMKAQPEE